jgi:hypothetical protein
MSRTALISCANHCRVRRAEDWLESSEVFAIQDEIAERVAGAIEPELLKTESSPASARHTRNMPSRSAHLARGSTSDLLRMDGPSISTRIGRKPWRPRPLNRCAIPREKWPKAKLGLSSIVWTQSQSSRRGDRLGKRTTDDLPQPGEPLR